MGEVAGGDAVGDDAGDGDGDGNGDADGQAVGCRRPDGVLGGCGGVGSGRADSRGSVGPSGLSFARTAAYSASVYVTMRISRLNFANGYSACGSPTRTQCCSSSPSPRALLLKPAFVHARFRVGFAASAAGGTTGVNDAGVASPVRRYTSRDTPSGRSADAPPPACGARVDPRFFFFAARTPNMSSAIDMIDERQRCLAVPPAGAGANGRVEPRANQMHQG
jgi:hypothetical protein